MSLRLSGGRRLHSPPGHTARPTPARVRLAVMNMLSHNLRGCRWLDLFCGSGVMGCEALLHGARSVVAVDQNRAMAATARRNLEMVAAALNPQPEVEIHTQEVLRWLEQSSTNAPTPFELIYADPPYAAGLYETVLRAVESSGLLSANGRIILECSSTAIPKLPDEGWQLIKQKRYGSSTVLVFEPS